jgi:hypothetical protein
MGDFEPVGRAAHGFELKENLAGLPAEDREDFALQMAVAEGLAGEVDEVERTCRGLNALCNQHRSKVSF